MPPRMNHGRISSGRRSREKKSGMSPETCTNASPEPRLERSMWHNDAGLPSGTNGGACQRRLARRWSHTGRRTRCPWSSYFLMTPKSETSSRAVLENPSIPDSQSR